MNTTKFLIINTFGVLVFLLLASRTWIEPELSGIPGASGGSAIVWGLTALPILVTFIFVNFGVATWACICRYRGDGWPLSKWVWLIAPIWMITVYVDGIRHGI